MSVTAFKLSSSVETIPDSYGDSAGGRGYYFYVSRERCGGVAEELLS
jgi:hypothetical protein